MRVPQCYTWESRTLVEIGSGCRTMAPTRFKEMGSRRVAMVTDKGLVAAGVANQVEELFKAQGMPLVGIFDKVERDALTANINDCARWCREIAADGFLAVGGGSVLDVVKAVKVLCGLNVVDVNKIIPGIFKKPDAKLLGIPHVSIPTTAGTGAEVSNGSVIFKEAEKVKTILAHPYMGSDYAFLDPDLTVSLPPKLTAETAFDALSHALEAFFSPRSNSMSDAMVLHACRLIMKYLPQAVQNGEDIEARTELLAASCLANIGLSNANGIIPIHNFAQAMGGLLRIPHGEGNAVFAPIVMKNFPSYYQPRIKYFAQGLNILTDTLSDAEILNAVVLEIVRLQKKCNVAPTFSVVLDADGLKEAHQAVKRDPVARNLPIPDEIISACLNESFVIKNR